MNDNELAQALLDWADKKAEIEELEARIKPMVLERGETINVGSVRATYRSARQTFDYQKAVEVYLEIGSNQYEEAVNQRTTIIRKVDWKGICYDENMEQTNIPVEIGEPSVSIRIVTPKE